MRDLRPGETARELSPDDEKLLNDEQRGLYNRLRTENGLPLAELPYDGDARLEKKVAALNTFVEQFSAAAHPKPDFHGPAVMTRFPVGKAPEEIDALGHVRIVPGFDQAEVERHRGEEEVFEDAAAAVRQNFAEVSQLQQAAANATDPVVARMYHDRALELNETTVKERDRLRAMRVEQYRERGLSESEAIEMVYETDIPTRLGETKPVADAVVTHAVEMAKSGDLDGVLAAHAGMDQRERYLFQRELDRVNPRLAEEITDRLEDHLLGAE